MKRNKSLLTIFTKRIWTIAFLLFALILATSHFSFRYAAKYISRDSGGDGARVAKFDFTITSALSVAPQELLQVGKMKPGDTVSYTVSVTNKSEVALICSVSASNLTGNLPLTMPTKQVAIEIGATKELTFSIEWKTENSSSASFDYMGKTDLIRLEVSVAQAD